MEHDELTRLLQAVRTATDERLRRDYDRSLPFADGLFDRWERARRLGFGEGASIYDSALVYGEVSVGAHTWVGPYTLLDGSGGGLRIGSYCSVSAGVQIYTHDTVQWALSGGTAPRRTAPVTIGDRTYIGSQCVIAAGVSIGQGCVVGANSYVNAGCGDGVILAGSPARPIGEVVADGDGFELRYFDER